MGGAMSQSANVRVQMSQEAILCAVCGDPLPARPERRYRRHCSPRCRIEGWRQARLPLDPAPEPVMPIGPTPEQIRKAHKPGTIKVLRLLQAAGPRGVTTGEFLAAYIGRFGARLAELKAVRWQILRVDESAHSSRYTLIGPPPPEVLAQMETL